MKLRLAGSLVYTVEIVAQPIGPEGEFASATIDGDEHVIKLKASLGPEQRRRELRHEVFHALDWHWPGERDAEQEATFAAHATDQLEHAMAELGGWKTLDELYNPPAEKPPVVIDRPMQRVPLISSPPTTRGATQLARPIRDGNPYCGRCDRLLSPTFLVDDVPQFSDHYRCLLIHRRLFCSTCSTILEWREGSTETGRPNGIVVVRPSYTGDQVYVNRFIHQHAKIRSALGIVAHPTRY